MTENEAKNKKYVIIDKTNGFGYASSKYADMFNMTMPEHATVFENREVAEKIALSLNLNKGYKLQVFDYEEALLDNIKEQAEKVKQSADDNLTQNRMWSIIRSIEKLHKSFKEIQQYRAIGLTPKMVKDMIESEKLASHAAIIRGVELELYQEIGTIEEFKALKEKNEPKKAIILDRRCENGDEVCVEWKCPVCGLNVIEEPPCQEYCQRCGNKLDWN